MTGKLGQALHVSMAILVLATVGFGQDAGLMRADQAFVEAVAHNDHAALEELLDVDFTWTSANGMVQTKAQVLRNLPQPLADVAKGAEFRVYTYGELGDIQLNEGRAHVLRVWAKRSNGWKAVVYQEVLSLDAPPSFSPGAGKGCENPCKTIPFKPRNEQERQVALAYTKLETAANARNSAAFGPLVGDEFVAASSYSNKLQNKRSRMDDFDHSKDAGLAPTPLLSARMLVFGDAVLMISEHQPDRGNPLHVTRVWVKREGNWMETASYQTAIVSAR